MSPSDRNEPVASAGGDAAQSPTSHETRADALERKLLDQLNKAASNGGMHPPAGAAAASSPQKFLTVAELDAQINTRPYRRGVGRGFWSRSPDGRVSRLPSMPQAPTLVDFFALRLPNTGNHCLQSANKALQRGADEEIVFACLLHDIVQEIMCADHGYWGAQMLEPYVSERVAFAIRYHQALRFFPDEKAGYAYPAMYRRLFGEDYVPDRRLQETHQFVRKHRWYDAPREVTICDLYAFDPKVVVTIDRFVDLIGRHFKQPREGLGNDDSPVAHMWRTMANPDAPL